MPVIKQTNTGTAAAVLNPTSTSVTPPPVLPTVDPAPVSTANVLTATLDTGNTGIAVLPTGNATTVTGTTTAATATKNVWMWVALGIGSLLAIAGIYWIIKKAK